MTTSELAVPIPTKPAERPAEGKFVPSWQLAVLVALVILLYYAVLAKLGRDWWTDPNFSHGFLVPLFSGFLVWRDRETLSKVPVQPSWWGAPIVAGSLALLIVGRLGSELFLSRTSLIFLVGGMVVLFRGWQFFREVAFPWAFLFLMVPIPAIIFNQITFPLQLLASRVASVILPIFGVPVLREGNVIRLPSMPLEVAEACSGIRSLMSLGTLAIIYGYFLDNRNSVRIALAVASIPIAVAANALRVVLTGLLVQYWDPEKALGFFHEFSGWVIFVLSLMLLLGVHRILAAILPKKVETSQ